MRRIVVLGSSGAGKTTMASELASRLGLAHIELDGIFHQAGWVPLESSEFQRRVQDAIDESPAGWTMCGGYDSHLGEIRDANADTVVWLDLPKKVVMLRVIRRTIRRAVMREVLWNGNREPLANFYRWDPARNVIRYSWVTFETRRALYEARMQAGRWDHLDVHRLRSTAEVAAFAANLGADPEH